MDQEDGGPGAGAAAAGGRGGGKRGRSKKRRNSPKQRRPRGAAAGGASFMDDEDPTADSGGKRPRRKKKKGGGGGGMTPNYVSGYDDEEEEDYGEETGQKKRRNKGAAAMGYDDYDEEEAQDYDEEQDEPMFDEDGNEIIPAKKKGKKGDIDEDNVAYFDMEGKPNNLADDGVFEGTPKDPAELLVEPTMDVFLADDSTDLVPVSYRQVKKWQKEMHPRNPETNEPWKWWDAEIKYIPILAS
jgi:hypothetical protein